MPVHPGIRRPVCTEMRIWLRIKEEKIESSYRESRPYSYRNRFSLRTRQETGEKVGKNCAKPATVKVLATERRFIATEHRIIATERCIIATERRIIATERRSVYVCTGLLNLFVLLLVRLIY